MAATNDFDFQPVLMGKRVTIRPASAADWSPMLNVASDPKIWEQHPASDRYREDIFRQYFEDAIESGSAFTFINRENGKVIGSSRYHGLDPVKREIEIGWTFLARDYWGGSYNAEIKQLMLGHAFRFVDTVVFWVGEKNMRSRRAVVKLGAVLRKGVFRREAGGDEAQVIYEVRKDAWQES